MLHSWSKDSMPSKRVRSHNNSASTSRSTAEDISMDVAITAALARSFQVSGVDTNLEDIKMDVDRMNTSLSSIEERLSRMENKIDFILEKYESVTLTYTEPLEAAEFIPKGTLHNEISGWIRTAMGNLMVEDVRWNFQLPFRSPENLVVTNSILDFVGVHISAKTGDPWTRTLSLRELKQKINLVFQRNKSKINMPNDKKSLLKKINVRKTRRVTKSQHRKQIIEHELFGPAMREFFGDDVSKLLREQLQSDEESTDSEMGETEKTGRLRVVRPSWRSKKAVEAFKKFDEYDIELRKNARKERESRAPGRTKVVDIKKRYLDEVPEWAKTNEYY
ncbi:hypothetical protein HPULCUR_006464 [Helicostylum pulchrum]|uniref:Uncharacterized protein n=1 Tax=Helicostylum pulchrum TaxID=562976 RepID=A0ABP9Y234_9FUNG